MSKLVSQNLFLIRLFLEISKFWGDVTILGDATVLGYVKLVRVCKSNEGISNLWVYVKLVIECQTCEGINRENG